MSEREAYAPKVPIVHITNISPDFVEANVAFSERKKPMTPGYPGARFG